jgi:hypothetical protein
MDQKSQSKEAEQNSSAPKPEEPTESKETPRDIAIRLASTNPRFKMAEKSGQGFVIGGVKRSTTSEA